MLKKGWEFLKENIAVIITIMTALLTIVYAALKLLMYVYWKGYFVRLNIDVSIMSLNFDKSIFAVVFVSIILFVVIFFMEWVYEIINDIEKKGKERQTKGIKKFFYKIMDFAKELFLSLFILSIINLPLTMLLMSVAEINVTISNILYMYVFLLLYIMEMLLIFTQNTTRKSHEKKEKTTERDIAIKIIEILVFVFGILVASFYEGNQEITKKNNVQLVNNETYMISYCDGEHYVLHKVKYEEEEITIYRNEQKIVGIEDCEYSVKKVKNIIIED